MTPLPNRQPFPLPPPLPMSGNSSVLLSRKESRWTVFICSLNFLLSLMGYVLGMSLMTPFASGVEVGETAMFTYPFRAFQMLVAFAALYSVRNRPFPRLNVSLGLLVLFLLMYLARAFWDLVVDPPYNSPFAWSFHRNTWYHWCYIFVDFFPLLAIAKGYKAIELNKTLRWLLIFGGIGLTFCLRSVTHIQAESIETIGRAQAGASLHTLALGGFGAYMSLAAFWAFFDREKLPGVVWRIVSVVVSVLAFYIMVRAGSRGPILGVAVVVCFWFGCRRRNVLVGLIACFFSALLIIIFKDQLLELLRNLNPTIASRLEMTIYGGDTSGRSDLWFEYGAEVFRHPIFGFQLDILGSPHSMFLDGFMMFGLVFGWINIILIVIGIFKIYFAGKAHEPNFWWCLILMHVFSQTFTGGRLSAAGTLAPLLLLLILSQEKKNQQRKPRKFLRPLPPPLPPRNLPAKPSAGMPPSAGALPREREQS